MSTKPVTDIGHHLTVYRCAVSNAAGSATSAGEFLFVTTTVKAPTDTGEAVMNAA